jgi:membrane protease subunit HflK
MAWNPHGGGQGPWGGGGGGGGGGPTGPQPPDIEDMLRRGQERFKNIMPGGLKTSRGILLIVIALLGIWLASGFYRVDAAQQGVVLLCGKKYSEMWKKFNARTSVFAVARHRSVQSVTSLKKA